MIWLPVDTADTSAALPNLPTISKSTAPYIVCKNSAAKIGIMNLTSGEKIFPSVKSLTLDIYYPPKYCFVQNYITMIISKCQ